FCWLPPLSEVIGSSASLTLIASCRIISFTLALSFCGFRHFQARLKKGLALVPEDRQGEGVVQMMSIQSNMTLSDFSLQGFRRAWK
ncbi:hypothetical protein ACSLO8_30620, partial [Escherichia coli]